MRVRSAFLLFVGCTGVAPPTDSSRPVPPISPHVAVYPESDVAGDRTAALATGQRLVVGRSFACAVLGDGRVDCWGDAAVRKVPEGTFTALSAGERHVCGLKSDRRAVCWGWNDYGQTNAPADEFVALAADHWSSCGLRDDMTSACWGYTDDGRIGVLPDRLRKLVNVHPHRCGLRADGTMTCTPYGDPSVPYSGPHYKFDDEPFIDIAISDGLACGLRADGTLRCQGHRADEGVPTSKLRSLVSGPGICGLTSAGEAVCFGQDQPLPAAPPGPYRRVVSGRASACGVRTDGELACWPPSRAPLPRGPFAEVALAEGWGCARADDGRVACFGPYYAGQTAAPAGEFRAIASGVAHSCAIEDSGRLACWGQNADGQASPPRGKYTAVACGELRSCAASERGALRCWGAPYKYGPPPADLRVRAIAMSNHLECAVLVDGGVECWGQNRGKLDVSRVRGAVAVAVAQDELRVHHADGSETCFASEERGGGGGGAVAPEWGPAPCPAHKISAVGVNMSGTCTLDEAGAIACTRRLDWANSPISEVAKRGPFDNLSMRGDLGCALTRTGELVCWGGDRFGEASPPPGKYRSVAVGEAHGCAIRDDDTLVCWGSYAGGVPL